MVAKTAGTVSQGTAPVKLMNVGESEVTLQANTCLGSFYAAVSNDVKVARVDIYEFVDSKIEARDITRSPSCSRVKQVSTVCLKDTNLSRQQQKAAELLLTEFHDIFSESKEDLGRANLTQHGICPAD